MTDVLTTEVLADDAPFNGLVGQRLLRKEDPKLLTGEGKYTDDIAVAARSKSQKLKGLRDIP